MRGKKRKKRGRKRDASVALLRDDAVLEPQVEAAFVLVIPHRGLELRKETAEDVLAEAPAALRATWACAVRSGLSENLYFLKEGVLTM